MTQNTFTPEIADKLLDKLSTDDQYREQFLGNPALALHMIGINVDPSQVPAVRKLPSKQSLQANREAIKNKLVGSLGMIWFFVE